MICSVNDSDEQPAYQGRLDTPEIRELRALRERQPQLASAVNMHIDLLAVQRRVQSRIPLPSISLDTAVIRRHQDGGRPLLRFEQIPLDSTDLRLVLRQTADIMRRFEALNSAENEKVKALERDVGLVLSIRDWYRAVAGKKTAGRDCVNSRPKKASAEVIACDQVVMLTMRPFLSRCAEILQPRPDLTIWTHPHCPLCGGEPELAVITPAAERHLICGRCMLHWNFDPLTCPYCLNLDRSTISSFATPDRQYRVYACDLCKRYLKAYDGRRSVRPVMPILDSVATLPLDAAAMQRGYEG